MIRIGMVKRFDKLGRIVIPKKLRERYKLLYEVELIPTEEGILIRNPEFIFIKKEDKK